VACTDEPSVARHPGAPRSGGRITEPRKVRNVNPAIRRTRAAQPAPSSSTR
jgi:hypothetical protein